MDYFLYIFPVFFLFFAVFYLFIGFKAIIKNKPYIINSKWVYAIIVFLCLPSIIFSIKNILEFSSFESSGFIFTLLPILLIILMVFYYCIIKGYSIYCVSDTDFRNAVIFSLNNNSIKYEEKMNKIELVDINNELNISFTAWIGTGMIKLKNKKDKLIFLNIMNGIKQYFRENKIHPKKIIAIFYLIFGFVFILFSIGFSVLMINISKYFH
jgi:hypothetical protein